MLVNRLSVCYHGIPAYSKDSETCSLVRILLYSQSALAGPVNLMCHLMCLKSTPENRAGLWCLRWNVKCFTPYPMKCQHLTTLQCARSALSSSPHFCFFSVPFFNLLPELTASVALSENMFDCDLWLHTAKEAWCGKEGVRQRLLLWPVIHYWRAILLHASKMGLSQLYLEMTGIEPETFCMQITLSERMKI